MYFMDRTRDTLRWKGENMPTTEGVGTLGTPLDMEHGVV